MAVPSRPETMNTTSHHAKVRTALRFAEETFVSGGVVAGKMEVESKADKALGIGIIMVELLATEELLSRDHSATQTFLQIRRMFQGPGLPASNAVYPHPLPGELPLPLDYHAARKGTTAFLFRLPLPTASPPSINFGSGVARIRYEVRAIVGVIWKGERQLVTYRRDINVIARYDPSSVLTKPVSIVVGENGRIWVKGEIVGEGVFAGQPACVALTVKNHSPKKNTALTVTLTRQLVLPKMPRDHPLQVLDTLTHVSFRGPEYIIQPGVEGVAHLMFDVPDSARSVKDEDRPSGEDGSRTSPTLFAVRCIVSVKMAMGIGSSDVQVDLPVCIYHPAVLPAGVESVPGFSNYEPMATAYDIPTSPILHHALSPSPPSYALPITPPPIVPFVDNGRVWLPAAMPEHYPYPVPVSSPPADWSLLDPPHVSPARPSSAEPIPSSPYLYGISGLPASSVNQPLAPLVSGLEPVAEREEGKGERASRFTHHLRMSSRARSVSPQSHRYAVSNYNVAQPLPGASSQPPRHIDMPPPQSLSPYQSATQGYMAGSPTASGDVLSPRPMPSPKQVHSVDPFTHVTFNKSERVEVLERLAEHTNAVNADMSSSVPDLVIDTDKTLPKPPVPSQKPMHLRNVGPAALDELFPPFEDGPEVAPPTPTLAAFKSAKASRVALGGLGGLDALEAKLLAEVGTRKVSNDKRPDVRSVLPMPIAIPRPGTVPDPPIDSAISSLSLQGLCVDEGTLRLDHGSHSGGVSDQEKSRGNGPKSRNERDSSDAPRKRGRKKSSPKERPEDDREKEQQRLRKAARGRVAAWLGGIDPEASPEALESPVHSPVQGNLPDLEVDIERELEQTQPPSGMDSDAKDSMTEDQAAHCAEPNPRSSGFMPLKPSHTEVPEPGPPSDASKTPSPILRHKVKLEWKSKALGGQLPANVKFAGRSLDPEVRYDVRSARGGRGGKVTAVAAIWASATQQLNQPSGSSSDRSTPQPRPVKRAVDFPSPKSKQPAPSLRPLSPPPKPATPPVKANSNPATDIAARRAKLIKSTSVPAVVSSSLATPMLSSTASLARPSPPGERARLKTHLPPIASDSKPVAAPKALASKNELAFGQARLRELIKKYQG